MKLKKFKELKAKDRFREGWIMLTRPFNFAELKNPLQKLTILYVYSEQPIKQKVLSDKALNEIDNIKNQSTMFIGFDSAEDYINKQINFVYKRNDSYEELYKGEIVQTLIEENLCRFYPDEYTILSKEKLCNIMQEEGYHTLISDSLKNIKEFKDRTHYLKSRGINVKIAEKWASLSYKDLVIYKPYYELLDMFCRPYEIYKDKFYEEIENIIIE